MRPINREDARGVLLHEIDHLEDDDLKRQFLNEKGKDIAKSFEAYATVEMVANYQDWLANKLDDDECLQGVILRLQEEQACNEFSRMHDEGEI